MSSNDVAGFEMLDLGRQLSMGNVPVEIRKAVRDLSSSFELESRPDHCVLCGKEMTSACKSHTIPRFILKHLTETGHVYTMNHFFSNNLLEDRKGVGNFETFRIICNDCDSCLFQNYESPSMWRAVPSEAMLREIALKNALRMYAHRLQEKVQYEAIAGILPGMNGDLLVNQIDLSEYRRTIDGLLTEATEPSSLRYKVDYYKLLDYRVPLAFQGSVAMVSGFSGKIINDVYNYSPLYRLEELQIVVFPLESQSVVLCFSNERYKRYRVFFEELMELNSDEQLAVIQYIIFAYSDSFALSEDIPESFFENEDVTRTTGMSTIVCYSTGMTRLEALVGAARSYSCERALTLPNLLSRQFALIT